MDYGKAREAFERAAAAGHSGGMTGLGWLYQIGRGVPQDYAKAREWYEKAAAAGNGGGMANLGWLYRDGLGVPRDYRKAHGVVREGRRRRQRRRHGQHRLALPERLGRAARLCQGARVVREGRRQRQRRRHGQSRLAATATAWACPATTARRASWYEKAAATGHSIAMVNVGWIYQHGWGVPQDYAKAREWYEKAAAAGNGVGHGRARLDLS